MWECILLCTIFGVFILLSYTLGIRNGQKLSKNEEIKLPEVNPITIVNNEKEKYEERKKQDALEVMLENIENYDPTGKGQQDIPNY